MTNYYNGKLAEFLARCYLRLHGYHIVDKNVIIGRGTTAGEIDIVAKCGHCLVFVEVKKRQNINTAAYAISQKQQQRIIRSAACFIQKHPYYQKYDIRFDAILIAFPFSILHLKNAWPAY